MVSVLLTALLLLAAILEVDCAFVVNGFCPVSRTRALSSTNDQDLQTRQFLPVVAKAEDIMHPKAHGTSHQPVQKDLQWGMDAKEADRICNFNRRFAEYKGTATNLLNFLLRQQQEQSNETIVTKFHDSVTGNLLFTAPIGRSLDDFVEESKAHGWPSFRDAEVNWDFVRCLDGPQGECVSITGTHLGHNLPDEKGNRYCINLVSIAGRPVVDDDDEDEVYIY